MLRAMARAYHNAMAATPCDNGRCVGAFGVVYPYLNTTGNLEDQRRVLRHPSFREVADEGYYWYPYNPTMTLNFVYHPAKRMEHANQKTITSNVSVVQAEAWEDVIIQEVWLGGAPNMSTLSAMFHVFYAYWTKTPAVGEYVGWMPFDMTTDRFLVEIVGVQLGGVDYAYREIREHITKNRAETYVDAQLTLSLKLARPTVNPDGTIVFTGI